MHGSLFTQLYSGMNTLWFERIPAFKSHTTLLSRRQQSSALDAGVIEYINMHHQRSQHACRLRSIEGMKIIILLSFASMAMAIQYELVEEWHLWKGQHLKSYTSELEELERHTVWLANKKYIEEHNARADAFGYKLAMNHLGDLVCMVTYVLYTFIGRALLFKYYRVQKNTRSST